ncbi:MAG: ABC transporter [Novosphingobium sp.]
MAALALIASPALSEKPATIGLFTSLPVLWPETDDMSAMLRGGAAPHWARSVIARHGAIVALDRFDARDKTLTELGLIIMPQPRALAPAESVALDGWVRRGGHLLLFVDPMLTQDSAFALGDKRRPMDIAMLTPLLRHWGLVLTFNRDQAAGERIGRAFDISFPINLSGQLVATRKRGACRAVGRGLAALCRIGKGRAVIVADAALFETRDIANRAMRTAALDVLIARAAQAAKPGKTR